MEEIKLKIGGVEVAVSKEDYEKGIEAGELSINSDSIVAYEKDAFESFKENLKKDGYKEGKIAGEEMTIKAGKEKFGLDFEGKTVDNLMAAFKNKVLEEAKIEPSKKIKELEEEKSKLQNNYQELETQFSTFKTSIETEKQQAKKDQAFMSFIPETGLKVDRDVAAVVLKTKGGFDLDFSEDGKPILKKGEQVIKDEKTLNPVNPADYLTSQIEAFGLFEEKKGGRGADDEPGKGQATDYDKFVKEMEEKGVSRGSQDFQKELNSRMKEGTLKI